MTLQSQINNACAARIGVILCCLVALGAQGADLCVGPTATGNGSGSDWTNVMQWSSFTPVRGNTYYLRDGTYAGKTLSTTASSTTEIIIRKATIAVKGTNAGWDNAFAGQAEFTGQITIQTHHWIFDGAYRNESNWWDETAYGFKIARSGHSNTGIEIALNGQNQVNNVSISNTAVILPLFNDTGAARGMSSDNGSDPVVMSTNHVFSRMLMRGGNQHWFVRHSHDAVIEYSASELTGGSGTYHGNVINLYWNPDRTIIRFNLFRDHFNIHGSGGTSIISITGSDGHRIYGNVFIRCRGSNGLIGFFDGDATGTFVYNNTFVDALNSTGIYLGGSGNVARNNLWVNPQNAPQITGPTASDNTTAGATSLFVDYAGGDYRLATNTLAGFTLSSPYDVDPLGNTRGGGEQDWSRGAYQFVSEEADETAPVVTAFVIPSTAESLTVTISTFTATDAVGVTGYLVNESASTPSSGDSGWSGSAQTEYVFETEGSKTLYAWAKDAANNISTSASDGVTITLPAPPPPPTGATAIVDTLILR